MLSCTQPVTEVTQAKQATDEAPTTETPSEPIAEPESEPVDEPIIEPVAEPIKEDILIKPIPSYPAYIVEEGGAIYGIPSGAMGVTHKQRITIETVEGEPITSGINLYTIGGVIYVEHLYTEAVDGEPVNYVDCYRQENDDTLELVDYIPAMPSASRVTLDSPEWYIESAVISGVECSYIYSRNPDIIDALGGTNKGAFIHRYNAITGYAVLDKGIAIMTDEGGKFIPSNRAAVNDLSEKGRLWK